MDMDKFDELANNASKDIDSEKKPFSEQQAPKRNSVWVNRKYYKHLKMLTVEKEHTSMSELADKALQYAFKNDLFNEKHNSQS